MMCTHLFFLSFFIFYLGLLYAIFMFCLIVEESVEKKTKSETHISASWFQKRVISSLIKSCMKLARTSTVIKKKIKILYGFSYKNKLFLSLVWFCFHFLLLFSEKIVPTAKTCLVYVPNILKLCSYDSAVSLT